MAGVRFVPSVWWLHYKLIGGWPRLLVYAAAWMGLMGLSLASYRVFASANMPFAAYCNRLVPFLGGAQVVLLFIFGSNAVHRALIRDTTSKMMESHRISPLSGPSAVAGLVIGPNLHVLLLFAIGVAFGVVLLGVIGAGQSGWLLGSAYVLTAALLGWTATIMVGLGRAKPTNPVTMLMILGMIGSIVIMVPAIGLMTGLYAGYIGALHLVGSSPPVTAGQGALLMAGTWGITILWGGAAARKYRRPDLPAFGLWQSLCLFLIWLMTNLAMLARVFLEIRESEYSNTTATNLLGGSVDSDMFRAMLMVSLGSTVLMGIFPMIAAAQVVSRQRFASREPVVRRDQWMAAALPIVCTLLLLLHLVIPDEAPHWPTVATACIIFTATFVSIRELLARALMRGRRLAVAASIFGTVFWVLPYVASSILQEIERSSAGYGYENPSTTVQALAAVSPIGVITELFDPTGALLWPGVAIQTALAFVLWLITRRTIRSARSRAADGPDPSPAEAR